MSGNNNSDRDGRKPIFEHRGTNVPQQPNVAKMPTPTPDSGKEKSSK